jgi:hypothetical protein
MVSAQQELGASRRSDEDFEPVSKLSIGIGLPCVAQGDTGRPRIDHDSLNDGLDSLLTAGPGRWDIAFAKIALLRIMGRDQWRKKAGEYDQSQK